jgi:hypothetical protein
MDKIKEQITDFLKSHDTHAVAAVVIGILALLFVVRANKVMAKLFFVLIAIGLFAGAWWWHKHQ